MPRDRGHLRKEVSSGTSQTLEIVLLEDPDLPGVWEGASRRLPVGIAKHATSPRTRRVRRVLLRASDHAIKRISTRQNVKHATTNISQFTASLRSLFLCCLSPGSAREKLRKAQGSCSELLCGTCEWPRALLFHSHTGA